MINSVDEAWRRLAEAMTFLEQSGELLLTTKEVAGIDNSVRFNGSGPEVKWEVIHHPGGLEDGN